MVAGVNCCVGVNVVGLRRGGFGAEERSDIRNAYRILYRSGIPFNKAAEKLADAITTDAGRKILDFIRQSSQRGIISGPRDDSAKPPKE